MNKRPKGMDYGTYKAMCAAKKTAPLDENAFKALPVDEDEPADGGDGGAGGGDNGGEGGGDNAPPPKKDGETDEDEDNAEKGLGLGDLRKSIAAFGAVNDAAAAAVGGSRETYLKARLDNGSITKSEQAELGRIWNSAAENPNVDAAGRPLKKSLESYLDPEDRQVVNAAPLLKSLMAGVQDRLDAIQTRGEAGQEALRQLLVAEGQLLKSACGALLEMGDQLARRDRVIKSLEERLGIVEKTPAAPRAVRSGGTQDAPGRQLNKSTTGGGGARPQAGAGGTTLQKGQVVRAFHTLVKAAGEGNDFTTAARLTEECAVFERTGKLTPGSKAAVEAIASS